MKKILEVRDRGKFECWLDRYNHIMELVRTVTAITILIFQVFILYKF